MSDWYWDDIKNEKIDIINNLQEFCDMFNLNMPNIDTSSRLDAIQNIDKHFREQFWNSLKKKRIH